MKLRPKIPMLQGGNNIWYNGIQDYDPTRYVHAYDTSRLVNPLNFGEAWTSRINGQGRGRYIPNPSLSRDKVENIEKTNKYYQDFTNALFNTDGTLSDVGKAYARLSDDLLPENSLARVYNGNQIRNNWITTNNDTYGRPGRSFNNIKDYLTYERNDNLPGGRHNVFLNKGKRYFYVDNKGYYHWVSPEDANKYQVSEKPVEYGWDDDGVYWEDYELTGPKKQDGSSDDDSTDVETGHKEGGYGFNWDKIRKAGQKLFSNPDLYASGRLIGNLINNGRVYDEALKGLNPVLRQSYNTHRQIVGDEATKQAYYRRAVQGEQRAAKPFTSDADRQVAYMNEDKRIGDELRAQGDLADNQEIRRTSDESNQHQWANIQRDTEVANANLESIIRNNAARHNLLAQKHSAQWSSIDNFLKGIENRKRQQLAEEQAIDDQIFVLQQQQDLLNNPRIIDGKQKLQSVLDKHKNADGTGYDWDNEEVQKAVQEFKNIQIQVTIDASRKKQDYYRNRNNSFLFAKSGTKITHKKKDDLLYKSTRDVVEHFRKMSKMSSDALNRRPTRIERLTPHPKGKTRRYQQGGVAPFTVYTPLALGGETTTSSQTSTSSTKSKGEKDETLDMIKELFKSAVGKGLPSDLNSLYSSMQNFFSKAKLFGDEISTDDIASMYLLQMQQLNKIQYLQAKHDNAEKALIANNGVNEFAVDFAGRFVGQSKEDGKIVYVDSLREAKENNINPLTNGQLLQLRATDPKFAGRQDLDQIAANGIGMDKIAEFLKGQLPKLGTSEQTIEGYTKKGTNDIVNGLRLLQEAPDGDYKYSNYTKEQQQQAKVALNYLKGILPKNMKSVIAAHAELGGLTENQLIGSLIASNVSSDSKIELTAVTGKASDKGLGSGGEGDVSSNPLLAMQREIGGMYQNYSLVTKDSNTKLSVNGTFYSQLPKVSEDMSIDKMLSASGIGGIIQGKRGITFGNQEIKPEDLKHIMYSNNGGMVVTLPCKIVNGIKQVNLDIVETYEKAERKALQVNNDRNSPQFVQALAQELKNEHLDSLLGSNGLPNKNMFGQFLVVEAYTSDKVKFDINSKYVEKVENPDEELEQRMSKALSTDNKKSDYTLDIKDHWTMFEGNWDDIYKGTVFIPLNNNPNAALNTWGNSAKIGQTTELEELYQISNKSSKFNDNNTLE